MQKSILKIAVTGPESTGKSTLVTQLAHHYQAVWVPEFARAYIADLPEKYSAQDVENIARGQQESIVQVLSQPDTLLFADTDLLVIKIWMQHAFGFCPAWILETLEKQEFDLYLLMDIDLLWQNDPQREHPHLRQFFFDWYHRELIAYGFPFEIISGTHDTRFQNAVKHVDNLILQHKYTDI